MNKKSGFYLAVIMLICSTSCLAQENFFSLKFHGEDRSYSYAQMESVATGNRSIGMEFKGKTKKQLIAAVLKYIKTRQAYVLQEADTTGKATLGNIPHISYRDFRLICPEKNCKADIIALAYIHIYFEGDKINVNLENDTEVYSTIFKAKLRITPEGKVASDDDLPFNLFQFVRPETKVKVNKFKNSNDGDAYPDSIFDSKGRILNQPAKDALEKYFNDLMNDLKAFITRY